MLSVGKWLRPLGWTLAFLGLTQCRALYGNTSSSDIVVVNGSSTTTGATVQEAAKFALGLSGTSFTPHDNETLYVALVDSAGTALLTDSAVIQNGNFVFTWPNAITSNTNYVLDYFVDIPGTGLCQPPPTDHQWSVAVPAGMGPQSINVVHNENFTSVCAAFPAPAFNLTLNGSAFTPHDGQVIYAALADNAGVRLMTGSQVVSNGQFIITFPNVAIPGQSYTISYFADVNQDGFCNVPTVDHAWAVNVEADANGTAVSVLHNENFSDVCAAFGTFSLSMDANGFAPHSGKTMYAAVLDASDNSLVSAVSTQVVPSSGLLTFFWPTLLMPGHSYELVYFVDVNGNRLCDPPPTDHAWSASIGPASSDVTENVLHNENFVNVCPYFASPLP